MLILKKEEASGGGGMIVPSPKKSIPVNKHNLEMMFGAGQDGSEGLKRDSDEAHRSLGLKVRRFNSIWLVEQIYEIFDRN
jgi:hypothetical protein